MKTEYQPGSGWRFMGKLALAATVLFISFVGMTIIAVRLHAPHEVADILLVGYPVTWVIVAGVLVIKRRAGK